MNQKKPIIIFAPNFKPMIGGVAEYTYQLAYQFSKLGLLDRVITSVPQASKLDVPVSGPTFDPTRRTRWSTGWAFHAKLRFYIYLTQFRLLATWNLLQIAAFRSRQLVIINWINSAYSEELIQLCWQLQLPYAIILYGKDIILSSRINSTLFSQFCNRAGLIIYVSEATRELHKTMYSQLQTPSYILYPGINCAYLDNQVNLSVELWEQRFNCYLRDRVIISTVARLEKRKGIDIAIRALAPLLRDNPGLRYIIAGNGPEREFLHELTTSLELEDAVKFVGKVTEQEKCTLLKASSIFVMPNRRLDGEDFEGFGISFLEASYFGAVVIGGRNGGVVEAIRENVSGLLIDTELDEEAIEQLHTAVSILLSQPEKIKKLSQDGRQYVLDNFQTNSLVNQFAGYLHVL
jgi:phosphatidyl-myo-inositol dimannoside synthase